MGDNAAMAPDRTITLAGAGLAGTLLAILLARHGWAVERERLRAAMAPLLGAG